MSATDWDLSDLYSSIEDPKIEADLTLALQKAKEFEKKYKGKITASLPAKELLPILQTYESIKQAADKPAIYASLVFAVDSTQGAFLQKIRHQSVGIGHTLLFFQLELTALPEKVLEEWIHDPILANYSHYLSLQAKVRPHHLSEKEEQLISEKDLVGRSAWVRLFDQELSHKQFTIPSGLKKGTYSEPEILHLLYHPNHKVRKAAAYGLSRGLEQEGSRLAYIFNMIAADKAADDARRKFTSPQESRHLENEMDDEVVQLLTDQVVASYPLVHDFYTFKKEVLEMKEFHEYDRYAPVVSVQPKLTATQAQEMVVEAFNSFSPQYSQIAETFFEKQWIDIYPKAKKQGGAFCAYTTPDVHPYILTNYTDNIESAFVLAHELGHGIHAVLAKKQTYLNFDWSLPLAETASVFGEMLLFDHLKETLPTKREKFALHVGMIDRIFSTVFRQISMYRFEQSFHHAVRTKGEQSVQQLNALWRATQEEMYGQSVTLTSDYDLWWSYIPHFIHTPFYVYAYAIGEMLTLALYAKYKQEGKVFVDSYLNLLSYGGSHTPQELLHLVGIDMHDPNFWKQGLDLVAELIQETKALGMPEGDDKRPVNVGYKD